MSTVSDRTRIDPSSIDDLAASFLGEILRPSDAAYDEQRKV